jgi:hypothetical protein
LTALAAWPFLKRDACRGDWVRRPTFAGKKQLLRHVRRRYDMTIPTPFMHRPGVRNVVAALAFLPMVVAAEQAAATVYKCTQADGAVLYADYACTGGAVVDIRPGSAAPDASQRLERARDELDRAAARREANEVMLLRREQLYRSSPLTEAESVPRAPDESYAYGVPYGYLDSHGTYGPFVKGGRQRPRMNHGRAGHSRSPQGRLPAVIAPPTRSAIMRR